MKKLMLLWIIVMILPTVSAKVTYNFYISGSSMEPTYYAGIQKVQAINRYENLTVGKIYCYRPDYRDFQLPLMWDVCHRLISMENDILIFKGDNNKFDDPPVSRRYIHLEVLI